MRIQKAKRIAVIYHPELSGEPELDLGTGMGTGFRGSK